MLFEDALPGVAVVVVGVKAAPDLGLVDARKDVQQRLGYLELDLFPATMVDRQAEKVLPHLK